MLTALSFLHRILKTAGMPVLRPGVTPARAQGNRIVPRMNPTGPTQAARVAIPGNQVASQALGRAPIQHTIRSTVRDAMQAQRPNGGMQPGLQVSAKPAAQAIQPTQARPQAQPTPGAKPATSWQDTFQNILGNAGLPQLRAEPWRLGRAALMGGAGGVMAAPAAALN